MGYRFDFEKMKITATGGIYVRTYPTAEQIIIDSKITEKPGMFSNSIFVQSLLPDEHTILVKKNGYYDYFKTIPVQEKQVTKLEDVLLIKKNIQFGIITDKTQSPFSNQEKFLIKNNNLYYSNVLENSELSATQKSTPILKKIVAFATQNNNIIWLGSDGFLYKSDLANLTTNPIKIILTPIKIIKTGFYKIITDNNDVFVDNNGSLLFLNTKTNALDNFYAPVKDAKISPDGKNIIYYNDNNIYISPISNEPEVKNVLYKSPAYAEASEGKSEKINNCLWLNNNYIIFTAGDKIIISEIDYRGNINAVTLPTTITIPSSQKTDVQSISGDKTNTQQSLAEQDGTVVKIKSPEIFFNQQDGKLYILTNETLLLSEKITP